LATWPRRASASEPRSEVIEMVDMGRLSGSSGEIRVVGPELNRS
jgi:hypothetical protein